MWNTINWMAAGKALLVPIVVLTAAMPGSAGVTPIAQPPARLLHSVQLALAPAGQRMVSVGERGIVLLSDDQGNTWRPAPAPGDMTLTGVYFADAKTGWAIGHGGVVLATRDGGENWVKVLDGARAAEIERAAAQHAAVGSPGDATARRLGNAERLVQDGADKPFLAVHFTDAKRGIVAGAYGLLFTTEDGGEHWVSAMDRIDNPGALHFYAVTSSAGELIIAGEQGRLYRAAQWDSEFVPLVTPYAGTFFGVLAAHDGGLLAYGLRGNAYHSLDRGATWTRVELPPVSISGGATLDDGRLVVVNEAGQVLISRDGGRSFSDLPVPDTFPFTSVAQAADGGLILSGARGVKRLAPAGISRENRS